MELYPWGIFTDRKDENEEVDNMYHSGIPEDFAAGKKHKKWKMAPRGDGEKKERRAEPSIDFGAKMANIWEEKKNVDEMDVENRDE